MARASIPVDIFNPGQVFACLGFLEAADVLLGEAVGGFRWTHNSEPRFEITVKGDQHPFGSVLDFLVEARLQRLVPRGYSEAVTTETPKAKRATKHMHSDAQQNDTLAVTDGPLFEAPGFPARNADRLSLPLRLALDGRHLEITHWCDDSSRNQFKLFAGQQRSSAIARQMLVATKELRKIYRHALDDDPLGPTAPLSGSSFKFDARKSWTAINAGYSPDEQSHALQSSPLVELLAPVGLEHARPDEFETRKVRYGVWSSGLPPILARPALAGMSAGSPVRVFKFTLDLAGKNKVVTFAQEETER
jgi:CRISPR-associated protein Csx14